MKTHMQTIDPKTATEEVLTTVVRELFELNCAIFRGVDREVFKKYLLGAQSVRTRIQIARIDGRAVGYAGIQVYVRELASGPTLVVRSLSAMLPAYRGRSLFGWFITYEGARLRLAHPTRPIFGFSCPVHPATYCMLARYAVDVWPQPERRTPPELEALMLEMAGDFGMSPEPDHPGVCHVGWCTIQDQDEARHWANGSNAAGRYYVRRNPNYEQGYGLLVLVPVRMTRVVQASFRLLGKRIRGKLVGGPVQVTQKGAS